MRSWPARAGGREIFPVAARLEAGRLHLDFGTEGPRVVLTVRPRRQVFDPRGRDRRRSETRGAGVRRSRPRTRRPARRAILGLPARAHHRHARAGTAARDRAAPSSGVPGAGPRGRERGHRRRARDDLRVALQEAVEDAPALPHSKLGGPWALDGPVNRGSYLFNFDGVTLANVDAWIALCAGSE